MTFFVTLKQDKPVRPGDGVSLELKRAPLYLRFVRDAKGEWDALDLLTDSPAAMETIVAAKRVGPFGSLHLDYTEKGRRRGVWMRTADYQPVATQPADEVLRDTAKWREWCEAKAALSQPKETK